MAKLRVRRRNEMILLLAICATSAVLGFALGGNQPATAKASQPLSARQSEEKSIAIMTRDDELLEFGSLSVRSVKVSPNRKFSIKSLAVKGGERAEDWIDSLELDLKNKSQKQITAIVLELQFPDTEINGPLMVYRGLGLGQPPNASPSPLQRVQPLALNPDETATFKLSSNDVRLIKEFLALRKFQLSEMNRLVIKVLYLVFEDGSKWSSGSYFRPNPSLPGGYERISQ